MTMGIMNMEAGFHFGWRCGHLDDTIPFVEGDGSCFEWLSSYCHSHLTITYHFSIIYRPLTNSVREHILDMTKLKFNVENKHCATS